MDRPIAQLLDIYFEFCRREVSRRLFSEALQQRLQLGIRSRIAYAGAQLHHNAELQSLIAGNFLRQIHVRSPSPGEMGTGYTNDGVFLMGQFQRFANNAGISIEMLLPEFVIEHDDRLRFLAWKRVGWAKIPSQQGRNSEGRKSIGCLRVGDGIFRSVVSCNRQVPLGPRRNLVDGGHLLQLTQLGAGDVDIAEVTGGNAGAERDEPLEIRIGIRMHNHAIDNAEDGNSRADAECERENGRYREARVIEQLTIGEADIL